jgi:hypothetical protein
MKQKNNKKAQGISLNMIIVAVIALIVLIVLIVIFAGRMNVFGRGTSETTSQYSSNRCEVPGTTNECLDRDECNRLGGSWTPGPEDRYEDCGRTGCCTL